MIAVNPHAFTSGVAKRSVVIGGHKTSVSLEDEFWTELRAIAARRRMTLGDLIALVDVNRASTNLSSSLRLFVLQEVKALSGAPAGAVLS
ncbi:Uncharacterised protein [Starkeya nomas]|uniref:Ribbon-helix-helix domain-containing protein n=1 Tax=Starkeya nomas TaxID=2666134 RepID=A0A5S9R5I0_9HYPH|nr:ribbon-helix-helix domain-containing protein [Starkeya nomas]CAA0128972.1 Uncharacterised protein [Starkeya nomas]